MGGIPAICIPVAIYCALFYPQTGKKMSQSRVNRGELQIAAQLDAFVADQVAPGTGVSVEAFWAGFETC